MRIDYVKNLAGLRGFAAFSVALMHIRYDAQANAYGPLAFVFQNLALGVEVFFVLSGFIIGHVHARDFAERVELSSVGRFLWARLARIYPVHLFMLLLVAIVLPRLGLYQWSPVDSWHAFRANLFLIHAWGVLDGLTFNQPSWTISAEWFAYLCFPAIAFLTRRWHVLAFAALCVACVATTPHIVTNMLSHGLWALKCLVHFTAGYAAYRVVIALPESVLWRVAGIALGPLIVFLFWANVSYFHSVFPALTVALVACLYRSGPIWIYANRASVYLGEISYSLYMSHIMTLWLIRKIHPELLIFGTYHPLRFEIPAVLMVAILMHHLLERPARNWMRRLVTKRRAATAPAE